MTIHIEGLKAIILPAILGTFTTVANPGSIETDALVGWIIRAILGGFIAIGAWLLRDAAKTLKDTHAKIGAIEATVAAHQVMFEHWLDSLVQGKGDVPDFENPGRRKSDQVLRNLMRTQSVRYNSEQEK